MGKKELGGGPNDPRPPRADLFSRNDAKGERYWNSPLSESLRLGVLSEAGVSLILRGGRELSTCVSSV